MKNKKQTLLILSLLSNFILLFLIFPVNRAKLKILVLTLLGYSSGNVPNFRDTVLLTEFKPISQYHSISSISNHFSSYPVIESHGHLGIFFNTNPQDVSSEIEEIKIQYFINLNTRGGNDFLKVQKEYSNPKILHFTSFRWENLKETDGVQKILTILREDFDKGAKGIKLWKNFGLELKKFNGDRLRLDDEILDPIFQEIDKRGKPVFIHTADPEAFFYPINESNERYEELIRHPEWSFYDPRFPKFNEIMEEREKLFRKYPKIQFVALHFGEFAHRLEDADRLLRENPNVSIDIAARIDELGRHPIQTREFFLKWQDRILFGMDGPPDREKFKIYIRFLETKDEYFDYFPAGKPRKGLWKISGLDLPPTVLKKIYYENAKNLLGLDPILTK
jgi:predicted TIM-barrel fold metal-dependent hydrolase